MDASHRVRPRAALRDVRRRVCTPLLTAARGIARSVRAPLANGGLGTVTLAFSVGVGGLLLLPDLPGLPHAWLQWLSLALAAAGLAHRRTRVTAALALGFIWTAVRAGDLATDALDPGLAGKDIVIDGQVDGLVARSRDRHRFEFEIHAGYAGGTALDARRLPGRVRLSWRSSGLVPEAGETWRLTVRLKEPRGFANPGGFDYERWLFVRGIRATGYVRGSAAPARNRAPDGAWHADGVNHRLAPAPWWSLGRLRANLGDGLTGLAAGERPSPAPPGRTGWVSALVVGDRSGVSEDDWQVLRQTGTAHLMAISGLHVGLAAGFGAGALRIAWWLVLLAAAARAPTLVTARPARAWLPVERLTRALPGAMGAGAFSFALGYAALAGFSVSTRRALLMVSVGVLVTVLRRTPAPANALALALLAVLVIDPLSPLETGFWLSFLAVALIVFGLSRRLPTSSRYVAGTERVGCRVRFRFLQWALVLHQWGRMQWLVAVGTLPMAMALFGQHPLVGPVANLIAVPWVSIAVVPPLLMAAMLLEAWPAAAQMLVDLALGALDTLWPVLEWLAHSVPLLEAPPAPPLWVLAGGILGGFALLSPRAMPLRIPAVALLAGVLFPPMQRAGEGALRLTVLDVGQGLAVVARTASKTVVYDTGPRYTSGFNTGRAVVGPYLEHLGVARIDVLILSHANLDHTGGARWLVTNMPVARVLGALPSSAAAAWPGEPEACVEGVAFSFDGVRFAVLHPPPVPGAAQPGRTLSSSDNDQSCVLSIEAGRTRALLTGDVERAAELALVRRHAQQLRAQLMTVPHHGSATSSTQALLDAVQPDWAVVSAGHANRYGFPRSEVVERYAGQGTAVIATPAAGAVEFALHPRGEIELLSRFRDDAVGFWRRLRH